MNYISPFLDKINAFTGIVIAIGTYALGQHWWLFFAYFLLNVGDWVTGWLKSAIAGKTSSLRGFKGILKKFGYWIMIAMSFGVAAMLIEVGEIIEVDLSITVILGWFVLVSLMVNELRSILENFVEAGYNVPRILTSGLEVVQDKIETITDEVLHEDHNKEEINHDHEQ